METELKFMLPPGGRRTVARALTALLPARPAPATHRLLSTYYDTPSLALATAGFSLGVRSVDGIHTLTLKSVEGAAGRFERAWPMAGETPDVTLLAGTPAADLVGDAPDRRVAPIFVTDIARTAWPIVLGDGTEGELAVDIGDIRLGRGAAHGQREQVRDLKLKLKRGSMGILYRFASEMHALTPLTLSSESNAARSLRLASGRQAEAFKGAWPKLAPDITVEDGLRAIVGGALAHLVGNLPHLDGDDIEPLHQARVALRRLRSALALFDGQLKRKAAARFGDALRGFGHVMGAARDWDVFTCETLPAAAAAGIDAAWLVPLGPPAATLRQDTRRAVEALVAGPAFTGALLALGGWVEGEPWASSTAHKGRLAHRPLRELAPEMLDRLAAKAQKRGRHIASRDPEDLHDLRKTLKKLRYGIEYLGSLYPQPAVKPFRKACETLQEVLGGMNDAAAAEGLATQLAAGSPELAPAIGVFSDWAEAQRQAELTQLPAAWRVFCDAPPFWR